MIRWIKIMIYKSRNNRIFLGWCPKCEKKYLIQLGILSKLMTRDYKYSKAKEQHNEKCKKKETFK